MLVASHTCLHCSAPNAKAVNQDVKQKILRLIQNWAIAFESKATLGYAGEVYSLLQKEGMTIFAPAEIVHSSSPLPLQVSTSPLRTLLRRAQP
jgi:hypothetical protein